MNNLDPQNALAYRLNEALMATTEKFSADHSLQGDIPVILGAANIYISGLMTNAPSKQVALQTLADCYEIQRRLLTATPDSFFGKGLTQKPDQN